MTAKRNFYGDRYELNETFIAGLSTDKKTLLLRLPANENSEFLFTLDRHANLGYVSPNGKEGLFWANGLASSARLAAERNNKLIATRAHRLPDHFYSQDAVRVDEKNRLIAVADGVGGGVAALSSEAARKTVKTIKQVVASKQLAQAKNIPEVKNLFRQALKKASGQFSSHGCETMLVAATIWKDPENSRQYLVGVSVGDSFLIQRTAQGHVHLLNRPDTSVRVGKNFQGFENRIEMIFRLVYPGDKIYAMTDGIGPPLSSEKFDWIRKTLTERGVGGERGVTRDVNDLIEETQRQFGRYDDATVAGLEVTAAARMAEPKRHRRGEGKDESRSLDQALALKSVRRLPNWFPGDETDSREERNEKLIEEIAQAGGVAEYQRSLGMKTQGVQHFLGKKKNHDLRAKVRDAVFPPWFPGEPGEKGKFRIKKFLIALVQAGSVNALERKYSVRGSGIQRYISLRKNLAERAQKVLAFPLWFPGDIESQEEERKEFFRSEALKEGGINAWARKRGISPAAVHKRLRYFIKGNPKFRKGSQQLTATPKDLKDRKIFFSEEKLPAGFWQSTSFTTRRWFLFELAQKIGKQPHELEAKDFRKEVFAVEGTEHFRSLESLLSFYRTNFSRDKGKVVNSEEALQEMKIILRISLEDEVGYSRQETLKILLGTPKAPDELWSKTSAETRRWFLLKLAKAIGKAPQWLVPKDLLTPIYWEKEGTEKKSLQSLYFFYKERLGAQYSAENFRVELAGELGVPAQPSLHPVKAPAWVVTVYALDPIQSKFPDWSPSIRNFVHRLSPAETRFLFDEVRRGNQAGVEILTAIYFGLVSSLISKVGIGIADDLRGKMKTKLSDFIKEYAMRELYLPFAERSDKALREDRDRKIAFTTYSYRRLRNVRDAVLERMKKTSALVFDEALFSPDEHTGLSGDSAREREQDQNEELERVKQIYRRARESQGKNHTDRDLLIFDLRAKGLSLKEIGLDPRVNLTKQSVKAVLSKIGRVVRREISYETTKEPGPAYAARLAVLNLEKPFEIDFEFEASPEANRETLNKIWDGIAKDLGQKFQNPVLLGESGLLLIADGTRVVLSEPEGSGRVGSVSLRPAVDNAIDAIADEAVRLNRSYLGHVVFCLRQEAGCFVVEIQDNGTGISQQNLERLNLNNGFSTKPMPEEKKRLGGQGIGLTFNFGLMGRRGEILEVETRHFNDGVLGKRYVPIRLGVWETSRFESHHPTQGSKIRWRIPNPLNGTAARLAVSDEELRRRAWDISLNKSFDYQKAVLTLIEALRSDFEFAASAAGDLDNLEKAARSWRKGQFYKSERDLLRAHLYRILKDIHKKTNREIVNVEKYEVLLGAIFQKGSRRKAAGKRRYASQAGTFIDKIARAVLTDDIADQISLTREGISYHLWSDSAVKYWKKWFLHKTARSLYKATNRVLEEMPGEIRHEEAPEKRQRLELCRQKVSAAFDQIENWIRSHPEETQISSEEFQSLKDLVTVIGVDSLLPMILSDSPRRVGRAVSNGRRRQVFYVPLLFLKRFDPANEADRQKLSSFLYYMLVWNHTYQTLLEKSRQPETGDVTQTQFIKREDLKAREIYESLNELTRRFTIEDDPFATAKEKRMLLLELMRVSIVNETVKLIPGLVINYRQLNHEEAKINRKLRSYDVRHQKNPRVIFIELRDEIWHLAQNLASLGTYFEMLGDGERAERMFAKRKHYVAEIQKREPGLYPVKLEFDLVYFYLRRGDTKNFLIHLENLLEAKHLNLVADLDAESQEMQKGIFLMFAENNLPSLSDEIDYVFGSLSAVEKDPSKRKIFLETYLAAKQKLSDFSSKRNPEQGATAPPHDGARMASFRKKVEKLTTTNCGKVVSDLKQTPLGQLEIVTQNAAAISSRWPELLRQSTGSADPEKQQLIFRNSIIDLLSSNGSESFSKMIRTNLETHQTSAQTAEISVSNISKIYAGLSLINLGDDGVYREYYKKLGLPITIIIEFNSGLALPMYAYLDVSEEVDMGAVFLIEEMNYPNMRLEDGCVAGADWKFISGPFKLQSGAIARYGIQKKPGMKTMEMVIVRGYARHLYYQFSVMSDFVERARAKLLARALWNPLRSATSADGKILDFLAGKGRELVTFDEAAQSPVNLPDDLSCRLIAVDRMKEALQHLKRRYPRLKPVEADWSSIPLNPASIERIVGLNAISYVPQAELQGVIGELDRILKPTAEGQKEMLFLLDGIPSESSFRGKPGAEKDPSQFVEKWKTEIAQAFGAFGYAVSFETVSETFQGPRRTDYLENDQYNHNVYAASLSRLSPSTDPSLPQGAVKESVEMLLVRAVKPTALAARLAGAPTMSELRSVEFPKILRLCAEIQADAATGTFLSGIAEKYFKDFLDPFVALLKSDSRVNSDSRIQHFVSSFESMRERALNLLSNPKPDSHSQAIILNLRKLFLFAADVVIELTLNPVGKIDLLRKTKRFAEMLDEVVFDPTIRKILWRAMSFHFYKQQVFDPGYELSEVMGYEFIRGFEQKAGVVERPDWGSQRVVLTSLPAFMESYRRLLFEGIEDGDFNRYLKLLIHLDNQLIREEIFRLFQTFASTWNIFDVYGEFGSQERGENQPKLVQSGLFSKTRYTIYSRIHDWLEEKKLIGGTVVYPFSGADVSTAFLLSDPDIVKLYDAAPFRIKEDEDMPAGLDWIRKQYFYEKGSMGYISTPTQMALGAVRPAILWEIEAMGGENVHTAQVFSEGRSIFEITFNWGRDAKTWRPRKIIYEQKEFRTQEEFQSVLARESSHARIYIQKADVGIASHMNVNFPVVISFGAKRPRNDHFDEMPMGQFIDKGDLVERVLHIDPYKSVLRGAILIRQDIGARLSSKAQEIANLSLTTSSNAARLAKRRPRFRVDARWKLRAKPTERERKMRRLKELRRLVEQFVKLQRKHRRLHHLARGERLNKMKDGPKIRRAIERDAAAYFEVKEALDRLPVQIRLPLFMRLNFQRLNKDYLKAREEESEIDHFSRGARMADPQRIEGIVKTILEKAADQNVDLYKILIVLDYMRGAVHGGRKSGAAVQLVRDAFGSDMIIAKPEDQAPLKLLADSVYRGIRPKADEDHRVLIEELLRQIEKRYSRGLTVEGVFPEGLDTVLDNALDSSFLDLKNFLDELDKEEFAHLRVHQKVAQAYSDLVALRKKMFAELSKRQTERDQRQAREHRRSVEQFWLKLREKHSGAIQMVREWVLELPVGFCAQVRLTDNSQIVKMVIDDWLANFQQAKGVGIVGMLPMETKQALEPYTEILKNKISVSDLSDPQTQELLKVLADYFSHWHRILLPGSAKINPNSFSGELWVEAGDFRFKVWVEDKTNQISFQRFDKKRQNPSSIHSYPIGLEVTAGTAEGSTYRISTGLSPKHFSLKISQTLDDAFRFEVMNLSADQSITLEWTASHQTAARLANANGTTSPPKGGEAISKIRSDGQKREELGLGGAGARMARNASARLSANMRYEDEYKTIIQPHTGVPWESLPRETREILETYGVREDVVGLTQDSVLFNCYVFKRGFRAVKHLIRSREDFRGVGHDLVELTKACPEERMILGLFKYRPAAFDLFAYAIPAVENLIKSREDLRRIGHDFVEILRVNSSGGSYVFRAFRHAIGLFAPEELSTFWPGLIEIAKVKLYSEYFFNIHLEKLKQIFTPDEFLRVWPGFVEIFKSEGRDALSSWSVSNGALAKVKQSLTRGEFQTCWPGLVEIAKASGKQASHLFEYDIPYLKSLLTPEEFQIYWPDFVEIAKASGENARYVIGGVLPTAKRLFTPEEFQTYWLELVTIAKQNGNGKGEFVFCEGAVALDGIGQTCSLVWIDSHATDHPSLRRVIERILLRRPIEFVPALGEISRNCKNKIYKDSARRLLGVTIPEHSTGLTLTDVEFKETTGALSILKSDGTISKVETESDSSKQNSGGESRNVDGSRMAMGARTTFEMTEKLSGLRSDGQKREELGWGGVGARPLLNLLPSALAAEQDLGSLLLLAQVADKVGARLAKEPSKPFRFEGGNALVRFRGMDGVEILRRSAPQDDEHGARLVLLGTIQFSAELMRRAHALNQEMFAVPIDESRREILVNAPKPLEYFAEGARLGRMAVRFYEKSGISNDRAVVLRIVTGARLTPVETALYRTELRALRRAAGWNVYLEFRMLGKNEDGETITTLYGPSDRVTGLGRKNYELVVLAKPEIEVLKLAQGEGASFVALEDIGDGAMIPFTADGVFAVAAARLSAPTEWLGQLWRALRENFETEMNPQIFGDIKQVTVADVVRYSKMKLRKITRLDWNDLLDYAHLFAASHVARMAA